MSEVKLDPSVIDALDLYQGERVVWTSVQSDDGERRKPLRKKDLVSHLKPWQSMLFLLVGIPMAAIGLGAFGLDSFGETWQGTSLYIIGLFLMISAGRPLIDRLWLSSRWGKRYVSFGPYAFMSCVITDRRVLFFDLPGETPVSVTRNKLREVKQGFSEGAQALLFYPRDLAVEYAFISTLDFNPALRALDR
ncbi:MAG: hypothetical protein AAFP97_03175 [Pseudomonadota bacterium]